MPGLETDVLNRFTNSHRETSAPRPATHETNPVAFEKQLEGTRVIRQTNPNPQVSPHTLVVVAGGRQCITRSTFTPTKTCSANLYRRIKRRVGRSLKRAHCKGNLVPSRKPIAYKLSGTKTSFSSLKTVSGPLSEQLSTHSHRQHHSSGLYKQGGWDEVRPTMCSSMENPDLVYQKTGDSQSSTHPQSAKCYSRQAIQTGANHSNGMVPPSRGLQNDMLQVARAPSVCHQVQQQAALLCLTGPSPPSLGSGCPQSALGGSGPICLPTSSHLGQSGGEIARLPVQQIHSDCTRVAQHALVLGSGDHVLSDPTLPAQQTRLTDSTIQPDLPQESGESELTCLAPIATALRQWQDELRLLKEDLPDLPMPQ